MFIYYESLYKELVKSRSRKLKWLARATLLWWARAFSACHFPVLYVHLSHSFFGFTQLLGGGRYFSILFISSTLNFLLFLLKNVLLFSKNKPILFKMLRLILVLKNPYASLPGIFLFQKTQNSDGEDLKHFLGMEGMEMFASLWKAFLHPL